MTRLVLYGALAKRCGRTHDWSFTTPARAMQILIANYPDVADWMADKHFRVMRVGPGGKLCLAEHHLDLVLGNAELHIVPVARASGGIFRTILGVALIGVGIFTGQIGLAFVGASLALSGIASLLTPQKKAPLKNYNFGVEPANVTEQGVAVPIAYGTVYCGSVVISSSVETEDYGANDDPNAEVANLQAAFNTPVAPSGELAQALGPAGPITLSGGGGGGKGGGGGGAQEANDTLHSRQIAKFFEVISEGPIQGFATADPLESIYLNNTPIRDPVSGNLNFKGVAYAYRLGYPAQAAVGGISAAETEVPVGAMLRASTPLTRTIQDVNSTACRVTIEYSALYSTDTKKGSINPTDVHIQIYLQENGGALNLVIDDPIIHQKTTAPYDKSYRFALPQPRVTQAANGAVTTQGGPPWTIQVVRVTPDSTSSALVNATVFKSYTEIVEGNFLYGDCAYVAMGIDAQLFGTSVPDRRYKIQGRLIRIPSNYDPVNLVYGTDGKPWDGTFKSAWTDNPAWIFMDLVTHPRLGLGDRITPAQIDVGSLYMIAQYCDQLVPDGAGGMETRYRLNIWISERKDALSLLSELVSVFRGICFWANGQLLVRADMPASPRKIVVPANVIDGEFEYQGTALSARHTVALTSWSDPQDNYRPSIDVYEYLPGITSLGYRAAETMGFGITSRGQAHRHGRWTVLTENMQSDLVTYTASLDHLTGLGPYDLIEVADPGYAGQRMGGRIVAATAYSIQLDAPVSLSVGAISTVDLQMPDDTIATRQLSNAPGSAVTTLTFTTALAVLPNPGALWLVATSSLAPRQFRVISVKEVDGKPNLVQIQALFHDPNKYALIEQDFSLPPLTYARFTQSSIAPPTQVTPMESAFVANGFLYPRIVLGWTLSTEPTVTAYEVQHQGPDMAWKTLPLTRLNSVNIDQVEVGLHAFRVTAVTGSGLRSATAEVDGFQVKGKTALPDPPGSVVATGAYQEIDLSWTASPSRDVATYEIWESPDAILADAIHIADSNGTQFARKGAVSPGFAAYYWIYSRDFAGNRSIPAGPAYAVTSSTIPIAALGKQVVDESILVPSLRSPIGKSPYDLSGMLDGTASALAKLLMAQLAQSNAVTGAIVIQAKTLQSYTDRAVASATSGLVASVAGVNASVVDETMARASADGALASQINTLTTTVGANAATANAGLTAQSTSLSTLASQVTSLSTTVNNNASSANTTLAAQSTSLTAVASQVTNLSSTVGNNSAQIQQQASTLNGLSAQYTVKINANGTISGFGLASDVVNGVPVSEFAVAADRFLIVPPGSAKGTAGTIAPFAVVNGQVLIQSALIGTVAANKIGTGTITSSLIEVRPTGPGQGLNVYGTDGSLLLGIGGLGTNVVGSASIVSGALTGAYSAYTNGSITIPVDDAWHDVQSLTPVITGGSVLTAIQFSVGIFDNFVAASTPPDSGGGGGAG